MSPTAIWGVVALLTLVVVGVLVLVWRRTRPTLKLNHPLTRARPPRSVIYLWMIGLAALSATVVAAQAADRNLPDKTAEWVHEPRLQLNLAFALALATFAEALRRLWRRLSAKGESDMRRAIRNNLGAAVAAVCKVEQVQPDELGCGLFVLQRRWFHEDRLVRVERLRLLDTMPDSGVKFIKGKGTVGECWQHNKRAYHSWSRVNARYDERRPDEEKWKAMPPKTKHGFTREEWNTMLGRYAEVLAIPVTVGGTFLGVIALDRLWIRDDPDAPDRLKSAEVEAAVGGIARLLDPVLGG